MIPAILALVKAGASALEAWAKLAPLRELLKLQKERYEIEINAVAGEHTNAQLLLFQARLADLDAAIAILRAESVHGAERHSDPGRGAAGGHTGGDSQLPPGDESDPPFDPALPVVKAETI